VHIYVSLQNVSARGFRDTEKTAASLDPQPVPPLVFQVMSERLRAAPPAPWFLKCMLRIMPISKFREMADKKEPELIKKLTERGWQFKEEVYEYGIGQWLSKSAVPPPKEKTVVLYFGGGGFLINNRGHLEFTFRLGVDTPVYGFKYATPASFPETLDACLKAYMELVQKGYKVLLAGDSAGANLAIAVCFKLQTMDAPMPVALYSACPAANLNASVALSDTSIKTNASNDRNDEYFFKICMDSYLKSPEDGLKALASPTYASPEQLSKLPPTLVTYSKGEMMKDQVEQLYEKMKAAGTNVTSRPYPPGGAHLSEYYDEGEAVGAFWKDEIDSFVARYAA
jgi:acetyl esterase/lipase